MAGARRTRESDVDRSTSQVGLLSAMLDPSFYPRGPSSVSHVETHISHLFFAGDLVYKIKKPVRFSFLDFSTLAKRRYFLQEELRLNRRLAPSVYLGVLPVTSGPSGWHLGGESQPLEYTLVMRRLPSNRMLPFLLERGLATPAMMDGVADLLASFHAQAPTGKKIDPRGDPDIIRKMWDDNLADIVPFVGQHLEGETFEALKGFGQRFISQAGNLLERRVREGRIREVHGDLHCEHICFAPEGIQIFDCIEFSQELRCCDVASEIAFLVMDLEFRQAEKLAGHFLRRYLDLAPDPELPRLLPFYKCYRALVRGKVEALQSKGPPAKARAYFDFARRMTWEGFKPFLVLISGLTGSGKSTLARRLSERTGARWVSSDATRKAMAGVAGPEIVPYGEGIYDPSVTERTYIRMMGEAERGVRKGEGVVVDATFQRMGHRRRFFDLARRYDIPVGLVECFCSEKAARERLSKRAEEGRDLSDGRWEIYERQKATFEPIEEVSAQAHLALDTEAPPEQLVKRLEKHLQSVFSEARQVGDHAASVPKR